MTTATSFAVTNQTLGQYSWYILYNSFFYIVQVFQLYGTVRMVLINFNLGKK